MYESLVVTVPPTWPYLEVTVSFKPLRQRTRRRRAALKGASKRAWGAFRKETVVSTYNVQMFGTTSDETKSGARDRKRMQFKVLDGEGTCIIRLPGVNVMLVKRRCDSIHTP